MRGRGARLESLVLLVALLVPSVVEAQCERVALQGESPYWVSGVTTWSEKLGAVQAKRDAEEVLLVADARRGRLLAVDEHGISRDKTDQFTRGIDSFYPEKLKAVSDGGVLFQLSEGRFRETSSFGQLSGGVDLLPLPKSADSPDARDLAALKSKDHVGIFWQWGTVEGKTGRSIIGFADVYDSSESHWVFGMVKVPWESHWQQFPPAGMEMLEGDFETLQPDALKGRVRTLFRLGYDMVATIGSRAYVLRPGEPTGLFGYSADKSAGFVRMTHDDLDLGQWPDIAPLGSLWADYRDLVTRLATQSYAVALFPFEEDLLVLSREPSETGTRWFIQVLSLSADGLSVEGVSARARIEGLSADNLWIAASAKGLSFLEQGPPGLFFGRQRSLGVFRVAAEELKLLGSSGSQQGPVSICR